MVEQYPSIKYLYKLENKDVLILFDGDVYWRYGKNIFLKRGITALFTILDDNLIKNLETLYQNYDTK